MIGVLLSKSNLLSKAGVVLKCSSFVDSKVFINKLRSASFVLMRTISDRRYSEKHEWVLLESDKTIGTVGVSNYAQEALGDIVYVQLPDIGNTYAQNDEIGAVESVKAASEIYTPVSGKIVQINNDLEDKPGLVNSSCYEKGWLFKIELSKNEEYDQLMNEDQYQKYLKSIKE